MSQAIDSSRSAKALEDVQRQLGELRGRANRASTLTLVVGAIALLLLTGYFTFGLSLIDQFSEPELLVAQGAQLIDEKLPEARASLEQQVATQAPIWAEGLSRRALDSMPSAREQLETYVMKQLDEALSRGTVMTEERFREFLNQNRDELALSLKDLSDSPELAQVRLVNLQRAMEKEIQGDLKRTFRDAYDGLMLVNEKLDRLKNAEGLTEGEQLERRVLLLARQIQARQAPMPEARVLAVHSAEGDAMEPANSPEKPSVPDPAARVAPAEGDAAPAAEAPAPEPAGAPVAAEPAPSAD